MSGFGKSGFGIGASPKRKEDARLLTGRGSYIDDLNWPNQTRALFLRAQAAHARIVSIDVAAARAMPGVVAVITGADLDAIGANGCGSFTVKNRDGSESALPHRPAIATDRIRHVGEAVALVIAEDLASARDALEAIALELEELDPVVDMRAALEPGAPQLHAEAPGNLCFDWVIGDESAADAGMARAHRTVTLDLVNNRVISNPMEPRGVLVAWDAAAAKLHMETNGQGVWTTKDELVRWLKLEPEQVRITTGDVGGGFGTKGYPYPENVALGAAARMVGRPIKWMGDRSECFVADSAGRDHLSRATAGFDAEHRLVALKVETLAGLGAHLSPFAPYIPTIAASRVLTSVYDVQAVFLNVKGVFTNTTPVDAYRGAGRPESIYLIERLMDKAARELGVDPIALRKKSYVPKTAMPYRTMVGETYDVGDFHRVTDAAAARADLAGFAARRAASAAKGRLRGVGHAYYIESILGDSSETARIALAEDGMIDVYVGTQTNGQGHETVFAQILSERIGAPFDKIRLIQGDSDRIPEGGGTGGSRSVTVQGSAMNVAADKLIAQLGPLAEEALEAAAHDIEFRDGAFRVAGTDRAVDLITLGARARATGRPELADASETYKLPGRSFPNGCHIAEVEIDRDTGRVAVVKYTVVDDFGLLINPTLAEGQVHGGVVQGIGQALTENVAFDAGGQLLTGSFMDYAMPRADDAPWMAFSTELTPSTANPIGMKGCGEAGTVGALAAVTNAALDALWPLGVRDIDMPMTPSRVWAAIAEATPAVAAE